MKRDMDLCRRILVEIEGWPTTLEPREVEIEGYSEEVVGYNAGLLAEEELIEGEDFSGDGDSVHRYAPRCLTYRGHEFLEHARDETRWKRAKDRITKIGGGNDHAGTPGDLEADDREGVGFMTTIPVKASPDMVNAMPCQPLASGARPQAMATRPELRAFGRQGRGKPASATTR